MIDALLSCDDVENELYVGGDAAELVEDVVTIIAGAYAGLLRACPDCAALFHEAMMDKEALEGVLRDVEEDYANDGDRFVKSMEIYGIDDEYEEEDNINYQQSNSNYKAWDNNKLFGFDELMKRGKNTH